MTPKRTSDLAQALSFCQTQADAHREATSLWRDGGLWRYTLAGWPCRGSLAGTREPSARAQEER